MLAGESGAISPDQQNALMFFTRCLQTVQHACAQGLANLQVCRELEFETPLLHNWVPEIVSNPERGAGVVGVARHSYRRERTLDQLYINVSRALGAERRNKARFYSASYRRFAKDRNVESRTCHLLLRTRLKATSQLRA